MTTMMPMTMMMPPITKWLHFAWIGIRALWYMAMPMKRAHFRFEIPFMDIYAYGI